MEIPQIQDDEVLLKIESMGLCGSDMQIYQGLHKYMTFPVIRSRVCGYGCKVGKNVQGFQLNDLVTMDPKITCGKCYPCEINRPNACEAIKVMGVHAPGAAMEYIVGKPDRLHKVSCELNSDIAALVEPLAVAVGSINNCGSAVVGANVVVVGAGTIGNLTAQAARAMGAGKVMLCDINPYKLELAKNCEIDYRLDISNITLKDAILKHFGGHRKADIIFECTGAEASFAGILDASRGSSIIVITGLFKQPVLFEVPRVQRRDIKIIGSHMYVHDDFAMALELLTKGKIYVQDFISRIYDFDQINNALYDTANNSGEILKTIIRF